MNTSGTEIYPLLYTGKIDVGRLFSAAFLSVVSAQVSCATSSKMADDLDEAEECDN